MKTNLKFKTIWATLGGMQILMICFLSLSPHVPRPVWSWIPYIDKWHHLLAYGVVSLWFFALYKESCWRVVAIMFVLLGIGIEFLQGWSGYRYFEVADMVANSLGVGIAASLRKTFLGHFLSHFEEIVLSKYLA